MGCGGYQYGTTDDTGEEAERFTGMKGRAGGLKWTRLWKWSFKDIRQLARRAAGGETLTCAGSIFITAGGTMLILSGFSVFVVIATLRR